MKTELGIWEIAVLALLREAPMHPYQMQSLLRLRHKDEILALKRGSLYHAIGRLSKADLIAAKSTSRDGRRPERTTYSITAEGRKEFTSVLRQIIAVPRRESSEFMAAMSFLVHLTPADALPRLKERLRHLESEIEMRSAGVSGALEHVLRINLVESEYLIAMLRAEHAWVRGLIAEISTSKLSWDFKTVLKGARASMQAAASPKE
ncbi:PadR family transcriptional regulator [Telmatobacter sp. DSM 110680]|uniref:PadR family transcriptional regulator n=1 Tax=Telmatobacter sp. DSM 110680 TaxID=3036704 RepID=A0AAU7DP98_9BACT